MDILMKRLVVVVCLFCSGNALSLDLLGGKARTACEAMLCLSSGSRPGECAKAVAVYFAIQYISWPKTYAARLAFLSLCPTGDKGLARAIANGAGRCENVNLKASLNAYSRWIRFDENETPDLSLFKQAIPSYCASYFDHPLTAGFDLPEYHKVCNDGSGSKGYYGGYDGVHYRYYGPPPERALKPCYLVWK